MDRCGNFPLLSAPHSLYCTNTSLMNIVFIAFSIWVKSRYFFFFTTIFISLRLPVHSPSIYSHSFSWTLGSIIIPSNSPLLFMCRIARVSSVESSSREEERRSRISRGLVDLCLDCGAHVITLPTHNCEVSWLQLPWCTGKYCHGEWVAQPRATEVGSCTFFCKVFAPVALPQAHTSFKCWYSRPSWS